MDCTGILLALNLCAAPPEPPPALAIAQETKPATCLTKDQARAIYKTAHLYWHTAARCWDNMPTRSRSYSKLAPAKPKPVAVAANGNQAQPKQQVFYPAVLAAEPVSLAHLLAAPSMNTWPVLLDLDEPPFDLDKGIDGCCWGKP